MSRWVVVAPDKLKAGPDANAVCAAIARGLATDDPGLHVVALALADGGEGTAAVLAGSLGGAFETVEVLDPLGRARPARWLRARDGRTAVVESAEASGLMTVPLGERDPLTSSTYGTGQLLRRSLSSGVTRLVCGAGGSATVDAGAGALTALGAVFRDACGRAVDPVPVALPRAVRLDLDGFERRATRVRTTVLSDVATPLSRNATTYGAQKGATTDETQFLTDVARHVAGLLPPWPRDPWTAPWWGAGGGLAAALGTTCGAVVRSGSAVIARRAGLRHALRRAHLVVTAEGRFDATSFEGKVPGTVLAWAARTPVPTVVVAADVAPDAVAMLPRGTWCERVDRPNGGLVTAADIEAFVRSAAGGWLDRAQGSRR